jgi:hypothetical protein
MLERKEPHGDYITRSCAAHPADLNRALAKALCRKRRNRKRPPPSTQVLDKSNVETIKVRKSMPLKDTKKGVMDTSDKNSFRDVHRWATQKAAYIGVQVNNLVCRVFDNDADIEKDIPGSFWHRSNGDILNTEWMMRLRKEVSDLLVKPCSFHVR